MIFQYFRRRPAWTDRILYRVNTYNYEDDNVKLDLKASNYKSHDDDIYRKSDHLPVTEEFEISIFGKALAEQKQVQLRSWVPTSKSNLLNKNFFPFEFLGWCIRSSN